MEHQSTAHGHDLKWTFATPPPAPPQDNRTPKFKEPMLLRQNIDKDIFFINLLT
jgi:hypothetical protein